MLQWLLTTVGFGGQQPELQHADHICSQPLVVSTWFMTFFLCAPAVTVLHSGCTVFTQKTMQPVLCFLFTAVSSRYKAAVLQLALKVFPDLTPQQAAGELSLAGLC